MKERRKELPPPLKRVAASVCTTKILKKARIIRKMPLDTDIDYRGSTERFKILLKGLQINE